MLLHDVLWKGARKSPDKPAVIVGYESSTYRQLHEESLRYACTLAGLGVEKGDRVGLFLENSLEYARLYLAIFRLGAVAVPIRAGSTGVEVLWAIRHCQVKVLFVDPRLEHRVARVRDDLVAAARHVFVIGSRYQRAWSRAMEQAPADVDWPVLREADAAVIMYTATGHGTPRGVVHTHATLGQTAHDCNEATGLEAGDCMLLGCGLYHGSGLKMGLLGCLRAGATAVFLPAWDRCLFLELLATHRPTHAHAAPAQVLDLLERPGLDVDAFRSLRYFGTSRDRLSLHVAGLFRERAGLPLSELVGSPECEAYVANPRGAATRTGAMGRPMKGVAVRLLDGQGREVPENSVGEVCVRSNAVMAGYWRDPQATAATLTDGWLHTGDLARQDGDGYLYFVGRLHGMTVRGGLHVAPSEVEEVLDAHPGVTCCGVVDEPDESQGAVVHAFVMVDRCTARPPTESDLRAYASKRLPEYKVPERFTFTSDLPLGPNGKIDRRRLREMVGGRAGGQVVAC